MVISLCKAASSFLMARPLWEYGIHLNFLLKVASTTALGNCAQVFLALFMLGNLILWCFI
jgi:hypothetical protein